MREASRIRNGVDRRGRPYEEHRPQDPEARAAFQKQALEELMARAREDPEFASHCRERDRMRARLVRRQSGILPRFPGRAEERLDARPFISWLNTAIGRMGRAALAENAQVSSDRIRILARGWYWGRSRRYEIKRVSFDLAYRLVFAAGASLDEIWPEIFSPSK